MRIVRLSAAFLLTAALAAMGIFVSGVVQASHNFSDVPTAAFYHNAVEWVKNRGITAGCATGLYCPNDAVTRGQMAVFLRALGVALTPQMILATSYGAAVDPDSGPEVCFTTTDYTPTFPQRILARGWVSLSSSGEMSINVALVYSTDAGVTWNLMSSGMGSTTANGGTPGTGAGVWFQVTDFSWHDLDPGVNYRFGVHVSRAGGTADAPASGCKFFGEVVNRNPGTTPLINERPR